MGIPILRPGRPDEVPELLEAMAASLARDVAAGAIVHVYQDLQGEAEWLRYLLSTGSGWVAEIDGGVAGFGITAWRGSVHWLVSLFVRPEVQRRGLGRLLLEQLWPPVSSADRATLVDAASRPAMSLYLSAGLTPYFPVLAFEGRLVSDEGTTRGLDSRDDWADVGERVADADAAVFDAARPGDHAHWTDRGFAFRSLRTGTGEWLGYGRWSPSGRLGPVVLAEGAEWPAALGALAADAARAGHERLRLLVPAANESALRWCQHLGMHYLGMEITMATRMPGAWSRCLIHRAGLP
jgi:GNAT superfamily N-acetyltransferase